MGSSKLPKPVSKLSTLFADAKSAKGPSGYDFAIADSVQLLNHQHWDGLVEHGSVMMSRGYLNAIRYAGPTGFMQRAGIIYHLGQPVAAFCTQSLDVNAAQLVSSHDELSDVDSSQLSKKLKRKALKTIDRRLLICGNVLSWGAHGLVIRDGHACDELWTAIAEGMYRLRRGDKLHGQTDYVIIKDLPAAISDRATSLSKFGYRAVETEPDMVLHLNTDWQSFEDYLGSLTKKYRKSARTAVKSVQTAGITVEPTTSVDDRLSQQVYRLYQAVRSKASVRIGEVSPDFFARLATELGGDFAMIVARQGDKVVGFVTVIRDGSTAIGYYIGIDYEANADAPIYHRLLFAVIEQAIRWRCERISFGRTALDAKARLGCVPEPMFVWIRHRVPVLNVFVRQLLRVVSHDEPPERNPFKATGN